MTKMYDYIILKCYNNRSYIRPIFYIMGFVVLLLYSLHPDRFAAKYSYIPKVDLTKELEPSQVASNLAKEGNKQLCALFPQSLDNELQYPNLSANVLSKLNFGPALGIGSGGAWQPSDCISQHHVALIIPYRNRLSHLSVFLAYMHPFLQKQLVSYQIFIIEQANKSPFNRAKLFNVGFVEAIKVLPFPCFIFHDVDLIPQNVNNIYACTRQPRHMSSSLNTFRYNLPYKGLFGGAVAMLAEQFRQVNGFSNGYSGWGGEDDDFHQRITNKGLTVCRFAPDIARYVMLTHAKEVPSENRYEVLRTGRDRFESDGLNNLQYTVIQKSFHPLYTWVSVDV